MMAHGASQPQQRRRGVITLLKDLPEFLTAEEFFELMRIGRNAGYDVLRRGDFPSIRAGRRILIPRAAIEKAITEKLEESM